MAVLTLLELAQRNKSPEIGIIEQGTIAVPEIAVFPSKIIDGLSFWQTIRTGRPSGAYRSINEGVTPSASAYASKEVALKLYSTVMRYDKALENIDKRGTLETDEMMGAYIAALEDHAKAFWYGADASFGVTGAFFGLKDLVDSSMVVDAGGTTDSTASSAWLVCYGERQVSHVFGNGSAFQFSPWSDILMVDPNTSTKFLPYRSSFMNVYSGVACADKYSFGRIKDITADSGKTMSFTLMESLKAKFPVGKIKMGNIDGATNCAWFMSKRSYQQLQASLTATSPTGMPAPYPKADNDGIPIYVTEALADTETLS